MAAGDITDGRRRDEDILPCDYEPGDYGRRGSRWWVCLPTGVLGHLDARWTLIEHEDGTATLGDPLPGSLPDEEWREKWYDGPTITVSPSIFDSPQGLARLA
jgi:hypothetical protein